MLAFVGEGEGSDAMSGSESEGEEDVKGEGQEEVGSEDDKPPSPVSKEVLVFCSLFINAKCLGCQ